jgi:cystathionine beta-lyase/cystathionine gamma-synthase
MSYHELGPEGRGRIGIHEGLVRLAVGIEDAADLRADLERALARATGG